MKSILLYLFIFFSLLGNAQNLTQLYNEANNAFSKGEYNTAISLYSEITNRYEKIPWIFIQLAHSYKYNLEYTNAENTYKYITETYKQKYSDCYFWLAETQHLLGKINEASINYATFLSSKSSDTLLIKKALHALSCIKQVFPKNDTIKLSIDSTSHFVQSYGIATYKNTLIYNGIPKAGDSIANNSSFFIYPDYQKDFKSIFSVRNISFSDFCETQSKDSILFTIRKSLGFNDNPQLYFSKNLTDSWSTPMPLNLEWKKNSIIIHPQIVKIDSSYIFLFSSNLPSGYGGMDIWYCTISQTNELSNPINIGNSINTEGDEICPFYDTSSKNIFFSSDWHNSIGGFDIFFAKRDTNSWGIASNIGTPINSTFNEFYYKIIDTAAFFTSNRIYTIMDSSNFYFNTLYRYTVFKKPITKKIIPIDSTKIIKEITLYFDHDCPHDNGKLNYTREYTNYLAAKQYYLESEDSIQRTISYMVYKKAMHTFFDNNVTPNFLKVPELISQIEVLQNIKDTIYIELQACTSLGGSIAYNEHLAKRRIEATKNYLLQEMELKGISSNKIIFTVLPPVISTIKETESERFTVKEAMQRNVKIRIK